jgi:hypothetical protein
LPAALIEGFSVLLSNGFREAEALLAGIIYGLKAHWCYHMYMYMGLGFFYQAVSNVSWSDIFVSSIKRGPSRIISMAGCSTDTNSGFGWWVSEFH